jgi:hypothetical protein
MSAYDDMLAGTNPPENKNFVQRAYEDVKNTLGNYITGAEQGLNEVITAGKQMPDMFEAEGGGAGASIVPEMSEEDQQNLAYNQKAVSDFEKETVIPAALTVFGILTPTPAILAGRAYAFKEGYDKTGTISGAAREATYGPLVDWYNQPDLSEQFYDRPVSTSVEGILGLGQATPFEAFMGVKAGRKSFGKSKESTDLPPGLDDLEPSEPVKEFTDSLSQERRANEDIIQRIKDERATTEDESLKTTADKEEPVDTAGLETKEPWEMTKEEWDKSTELKLPQDATPDNYMNLAGTAAREGNFREAAMLASKADNTTFEVVFRKLGEKEPDEHKTIVEQALQENKSVPEKVIKEYPDLAEKYKVEPEAAATTSEDIKIPNRPIEQELLQSAFNPTEKMQKINEVGQALSDSNKEIKSIVSPASVGESSKITARAMRENMSVMARNFDIAEKSMDDARKYFNKTRPEESLKFMDDIENGRSTGNKGLDGFAVTMRQALDDRVKQVRELGTGKLDQVIENYFPHIWKDPAKAETFLGKWFSKRPLEGSKSFLKHRTIPTIKEGVEKGLEPVSYNPVDLTLLKIREMDKYIMAHKTLNELKGQGLVKFSRGMKPEPDWIKIDDKISTVFSKNEKGELVLRGNYWAQPDVARLINNYLSPGLRNKVIFRSLLNAGNVLNRMQLGMSAFHLGFTSFDAMTSKVALATKQLAAGDIKNAAKSFAEYPVAAFTTALKGNKYLHEWYTRGEGAEIGAVMDALQAGGARAKIDSFYQTRIREGAVDAFKQAKQELTDKNYAQGLGYAGKAIVKAIASIPEALPRVIMEEVVPRQKLGVAASMMKWEMERNPNMTHEEMRAVAAKVWDSVDNRLGQLAYDNLFWNKTLKDALMLSVRSVGWNLGTWREIGGGVIDTTKFAKDVAKMGIDKARGKAIESPEFTHRMSYIIALPLTVGISGAVMQYLATGQGPQSLKDYFFPQIGGLDDKGNPERVSLPSYMKDVYHFMKKPGETITNKLHPLWALTSEILRNRDYYNTEIRHPGDSWTQQAFDIAEHIGKSLVPFAIQGYNKLDESGSPLTKKVLPFVGITPAPRDVNQTEAEEMAGQMIQGKTPTEQKTKAEFEKSKLKSKIRNDMAQGNTDSLNEAKGELSAKEVKNLQKDSKLTPLQRSINRLSADEALDIYKVATDEEKQQIQGEIKKKISNTMKNLTPEEQNRIKEKAAILQ